jgi:hypothetical protein
VWTAVHTVCLELCHMVYDQAEAETCAKTVVQKQHPVEQRLHQHDLPSALRHDPAALVAADYASEALQPGHRLHGQEGFEVGTDCARYPRIVLRRSGCILVIC